MFTNLNRSTLAIAALGVALLFHSVPGHTEELPADLAQLGTMTFGAGNLPPPGASAIGTRLVIYDFTKIADQNGSMRAPLKTLDATAVGAAVSLLHMTHWSFLGADYGMQVVVPYLNASASSTIAAGPRTISTQGHFSQFLNATVAPIMLQWRDPTRTYNHNFILDVQIPLGTYQGSNPLNGATDAYAIRPKYTFTYLSKGGFEVTAAITIEYDFKNRHEDYQTGVIGTVNAAVGQHIGDFTVGLSGYALNQFNGDQMNGKLAPNDGRKARVFALGPAIVYRDPNKQIGPVVSLKYLREFDARNRSQGNSIWLVVGYPFE